MNQFRPQRLTAGLVGVQRGHQSGNVFRRALRASTRRPQAVDEIGERAEALFGSAAPSAAKAAAIVFGRRFSICGRNAADAARATFGSGARRSSGGDAPQSNQPPIAVPATGPMNRVQVTDRTGKAADHPQAAHRSFRHNTQHLVSWMGVDHQIWWTER
jgi:hypothetical protein